MSESQDEAMVRSITRECEQLVVGMFPYIPLDRVRWLLAYGDRLRAENEKLAADRASYMDARHKEWAAKYVELQQQINHLRATALTASEAEAIEDRINEGSVFTSQQAAYDSGMEKVYQIAHPEPQDGSNG